MLRNVEIVECTKAALQTVVASTTGFSVVSIEILDSDMAE